MTILHVLNGDATRIPLEQSGVAGEFTVWADPLHDGPVPETPDDEALRAIRAAHLADGTGEDEAEVLRTLRTWDTALEGWPAFDEVVFWFEHDLFDQLILIRHLDWLARTTPPAGRFSLICIGEHAGVARFNGLGQLSPAQLLALFPTRAPISSAEIETGATAWALFRAPDPTSLAAWSRSAGAARLKFLPGALARHLDDLPGLADGLSRSERQILAALAAGAGTFSDIFRATQLMEERVFMGDTSCRRILDGLGRGRSPLVTGRDDLFAITAAGREVLAGRADHVALNGIDRWAGGVHLATASCWRWDGTRVTPPGHG